MCRERKLEKRPETTTAILFSFAFISITKSLNGCYFLYVRAQVVPFRPNAIPLAVKTPYMNFSLLGDRQGPALGDEWPKTVTGSVSSSSISRWVRGTHQRTPGIR